MLFAISSIFCGVVKFSIFVLFYALHPHTAPNTIPCKELSASRIPQKYHFVPCMTHSLNKDDRIPSACEEDLAVWMAMTVMMYLTRQSVFMGNPVLVPQGSKAPQQLGMPNLLTQAGQVFDHDVLEIHHAVPARRMKGFDEAPSLTNWGISPPRAGAPITRSI